MRRLDMFDGFMDKFRRIGGKKALTHRMKKPPSKQELQRLKREARELIHNPNNRRSYRKGFVEFQYRMAVVGWYQLIFGKDNVKFTDKGDVRV